MPLSVVMHILWNVLVLMVDLKDFNVNFILEYQLNEATGA